MHATSFWPAQLATSREREEEEEEKWAPRPQITLPKLAALQPCSPTVACGRARNDMKTKGHKKMISDASKRGWYTNKR